MDEIKKQELKDLLAKGKSIQYMPEYKSFYLLITGNNYTNGCGKCSLNYLYNYLIGYVK